jgi:pimeloyl-ACP methyl ester carboxylesterase
VGSFAESRREKLGMDTLVDDLEQLRQALAIDKWIPSGFSTGGMVTLMYASRYPHALAAAVPICTAASYHYALRPESLYSPTNAINQKLAEIRERAGMGEEYHRAFASASVHNQDVVDTVLATTRETTCAIRSSSMRYWSESGTTSLISPGSPRRR